MPGYRMFPKSSSGDADDPWRAWGSPSLPSKTPRMGREGGHWACELAVFMKDASRFFLRKAGSGGSKPMT